MPVVTGIGHETDFTIADFCADVRCATPTAAAELLTTDPVAYEEKLSYFHSRLLRSMTLLLCDYGDRLDRAAELLSTFDKAFSRHTLTVDHLFSRLVSSVSLTVEQKTASFSDLHSQLLRLAPDHAIRRYQDKLIYLRQALIDRTNQLIGTRQSTLEQSAAVLDTLSPLKTLARGYGIVSKKATEPGEAGKVVTSTSQVAEQEELEVRLHRGAMDCRVIRKHS